MSFPPPIKLKTTSYRVIIFLKLIVWSMHLKYGTAPYFFSHVANIKYQPRCSRYFVLMLVSIILYYNYIVIIIIYSIVIIIVIIMTIIRMGGIRRLKNNCS